MAFLENHDNFRELEGNCAYLAYPFDARGVSSADFPNSPDMERDPGKMGENSHIG
jgi:hypothetical protein